jgi:phenylacetate-CoA ligase
MLEHLLYCARCSNYSETTEPKGRVLGRLKFCKVDDVTLLRWLPRFRQAYREMETLAARERWSREEIEGWQLERLNGVWAHAVTHVPHYRQLAADLHLPDRFTSLEEYSAAVPILPRATLKENPRPFLSEAPRPGGWHVSSGSTGSPTSFYWGHDAHQEALRCRYRMQAAWGIDVFDRTTMLWGNGAAHVRGSGAFTARLRRRAEDFLRHRQRLTAYHLDPADLRGYLQRMQTFRPAMLYAYSTAAYLLALEAEASGIPCESLKLCCLSAEPALPHVISTIERVFNVPAVIEYGATECPLIVGEGTDRTCRVREDIVLMETIPDDNGRYEIVLSVLCNPSFPLLRYSIGDVTDEPLEKPARGFAIVKSIGGRKNEMLCTGAGRPLHPLRFDFLFGFDLADAVRRYRVHQAADGAVAVMVEVTGRVAPHKVARLQHELDELLEGYPVALEIVDALPTTARKHCWTTSELAHVAVPAR